jgi:hypothetical protein
MPNHLLALAALLLFSVVFEAGGASAVNITSGYFMSCAIFYDQVGCWGSGKNGMLGRGDTENWGNQTGGMANLVPIALPGATLKVNQVATSISGGDHTCLLFSNQRVKKFFFFLI